MRSFFLAVSLALVACGPTTSDTPTETPPTVDPEPPPAEGPAEEPTEGGGDDLVVGEDACETDADCVPAGCCHPTACVGRASAPSCEEVMCTMDCQMGTLDCGGRCLCHEGRCAARLSQGVQLE